MYKEVSQRWEPVDTIRTHNTPVWAWDIPEDAVARWDTPDLGVLPGPSLSPELSEACWFGNTICRARIALRARTTPRARIWMQVWQSQYLIAILHEHEPRSDEARINRAPGTAVRIMSVATRAYPRVVGSWLVTALGGQHGH